ncbi:Amino-acid acetyltransferase, mitochondrial [Apophysomyces sp. BC1021]|nr:Amino-acid acetyltransferase, mitochondrial [Apophysomyces sp. BC1021]
MTEKLMSNGVESREEQGCEIDGFVLQDLLINLMNTTPSKRELRHFLKRYVPQPPLTSTRVDSAQTTTRDRVNGVKPPKDFVNALLTPSFHQLAVAKVKGPFQKDEWQSVGSTLVQLQKLGLGSIVVMDNAGWVVEGGSRTTELGKTMIGESMALVEAIEKANGRARPIYGGVIEQDAAGAIHVNYEFIQAALDQGQIPVVVPILTEEGSGMQRPARANDVMVGLTRQLAQKTDTTPTKVVVINNEGGLPNHERPGTAHSLVNIQEENDEIVRALERESGWRKTHPDAMENLEVTRHCLAELPTTSSAVIVPVRSLPSALIANLVTDKPLYSSSLPLDKLHTGNPDLERVNRMRTTVVRHGTKIHTHNSLSGLDLDRLTKLLEASFQKKLDTEAFYGRLSRVLDGAIIAGDYEGAVLVTKEQATDATYHCYLDKFAIAPASQGVGVTDVLWKRMCDAYPELLWRSRQDNGVNKWYFERSNGYLRLRNTNWVLFWYGHEGYKNIQDYADIAKSIPASFSVK